MKRPFLALLATAAAWLAGCSNSPTSNGPARTEATEPTVVAVGKVETRRIDRAIYVTGSLHPDETVAVGSEVPGRVAEIRFDFGQRVRRGDVVAELDKRELQLQLDRARAALAQALARVGLEPGQENSAVDSTPSMRQALAMLEDARVKYESAAKLVKSGDISSQRFTEFEQAFRARQAAVEATRDELRTLLASVQALRAEVKLAEKRLADATVRAPFDGEVAARHVSPGQYLRENTPILTLVKSTPLRLRVEIPESAAGAVKAGARLSFTTDALPGESYSAEVRSLNPSLEPRSRSLTVEARLTSNNAGLRPGMFVRVELVVERGVEIHVVPPEALYTVAGLTKLFVIRDGKALERKLTPGVSQDGWVEVPADGLRVGDTVALTELAALVDGATVQVRNGSKGS